jgi:hypothetical protein
MVYEINQKGSKPTHMMKGDTSRHSGDRPDITFLLPFPRLPIPHKWVIIWPREVGISCMSAVKGPTLNRLRLTLTWPTDPDELNDVRNALYRTYLNSHEIESDKVLVVLQGLS